MADGRQRIAAIKALDIFNEHIYLREVYQPVLEALGIQRSELRGLTAARK